MKVSGIDPRIFFALLVFWVLLSGSVSGDVIIVGIIAALTITLFFPQSLSFLSEFKGDRQAIQAAACYVVYFLAELVKANLRLAGVVLAPALPITPGFVKVRTKLKSRVGRLLLANSITLTPGTLTVELDGEWLYVHWVTMEAAEVEAATARIVAGFERHLEVMYG